MSSSNYIEKNRNTWNILTDTHITSKFYDNESFINGRSSLNDIELTLLGDINGKSILHLQCHFGQDTISLARMEAEVTGVDLSDNAISKANELAKITRVPAEFICCDIYDLPEYLDKQFDIVYTSYGTISWLPDLDKWAKIISKYLKPEGRFIFVEFHPVLWMFDDNFEKIGYNYFNNGEINETETGTYADREASIENEFVNWNHGIGEVVNSLITNGLQIDSLEEYDYSPYNCFRHTIEFETKKYRIKHLDNKIPMVYSISCDKES